MGHTGPEHGNFEIELEQVKRRYLQIGLPTVYVPDFPIQDQRLVIRAILVLGDIP